MSKPDLHGLVLTRSERIIVVALTYLVCAPVIWTNGKKLFAYVYGTAAEARREVREERQQRRREAQDRGAQPAAG
jgi:hypothetical protein